MRKIIALAALLLLILPIISFAGTTHYFDPTRSGTSTNAGTYDNPFYTIAAVNGHAFIDGDDLYFKVGTTCSMTDKLDIDWAGHDSDRVVIGAYSDEGVFTLNGGARPVLDGGGSVPSSRDAGLVQAWNNDGYVTLQDLEIKNSYGNGVKIGYAYTAQGYHSDHNRILNCFIDSPAREGITMVRGSYNLIEACQVYNACTVKTQTAAGYSYAGASIDVASMGEEGLTNYNVVRGCTVHYGWEGIGVYKGARYTTVEYCTIYDCRSFHLYMANARDAEFGYNVVYESGEANQPPNENEWQDFLVAMDCESHVGVKPHVTGNLKIHHNYLAGGKAGIAILGAGNTVGAYQSNNKIYGNRFFDCIYNVLISNNDPNWSNNTIGVEEPNYSYVYSGTPTRVHGNNYSPAGFTWGENYFNTNVTGDAHAAPANYTVPTPVNNAAWFDSLTAGTIDSDDFLFVGEDPTASTCGELGGECCDTGSGTALPDGDWFCSGSETCWTSCSTPSGTDPSLDTGNTYGDPTHLYLFYDGEGNIANDLSGNGHDAGLTNPAWLKKNDVSYGLTMNSIGSITAMPLDSLPDDFSIVIAFTSANDQAFGDYGKLFFYQEASVRDLQLERYEGDTEIRADTGGDGNTAIWPGVQDVFNKRFHTLVYTSDDSGEERCLYIDKALMGCSDVPFSNPTFDGDDLLAIGSKIDGDRQIGGTFHLFGKYDRILSLSDAVSINNDYMQMINNAPDRIHSVGKPIRMTSSSMSNAQRVAHMGN